MSGLNGLEGIRLNLYLIVFGIEEDLDLSGDQYVNTGDEDSSAYTKDLGKLYRSFKQRDT